MPGEIEGPVITEQPPINTLFKEEKYADLIKLRDDPEAQMAAFVGFQNLNTRARPVQQAFSELNASLLSKRLGLAPTVAERFTEDCEDIAAGLQEADQKRFPPYYTPRSDTPDFMIENNQRSIEIENEATIFAHSQLFPFREALVKATDVPEEYKLMVLSSLATPASYEAKWIKNPEWIDHAKEIDAEENRLLRETFTESNYSEAMKNKALEVASKRIPYDFNALHVASLDQFETAGVDLDKIFIGSIGNKTMTKATIESDVAPMFFPEYSPQLVSKCWEVLGTCSDPSVDRGNQKFFTDGLNFRTDILNRETFKEFMDFSPYLIPVVETIAPYGFVYMPSKFGDQGFHRMEHWPEFIDGLEALGGKEQQLKADLDKIRAFNPHFQYEWKAKSIPVPTERRGEVILENNPFALCFEQTVKNRSWNLSKGEQQKAFEEAEHLLAMTPDYWKDGVMREYVLWATQTLGMWKTKEPEVFAKAIQKANEYMIDPKMSEQTRRSVATGYFSASLDPDSRNIGPLFDYINRFPQDIATSVEQEWRTDHDAIWNQFVTKASDIYRYPLGTANEQTNIASMKSDLDYAQRALPQIKDPALRDKATEQLIYAFTDIDYRDLDTARTLVGLIQDDYIRVQSEETIQLEVERENRGESSAWKKMERVRRVSRANKNYLADLLGFGTAESAKIAFDEFYKRTGHMNVTSAKSEPGQASIDAFGKEVARIKNQVGVTVNLDWDAVANILEEGRIKSMWENEEVVNERKKTMSYDYTARRDEVERGLGNKAKGGARDPHPVYGAVYSPNGRDEYFGAALGYGMCFIKLKTENITDRTSVVYDDSFNVFSDFPVLWDDATEVKAMANVLDHQTAHKYVEAQVLNGVQANDIESINIPKAVLEQTLYENGQEAVSRIQNQIVELRKKYPNVQINVLEQADAKKVKELLPKYFSRIYPGTEEYWDKVAVGGSRVNFDSILNNLAQAA